MWRGQATLVLGTDATKATLVAGQKQAHLNLNRDPRAGMHAGVAIFPPMTENPVIGGSPSMFGFTRACKCHALHNSQPTEYTMIACHPYWTSKPMNGAAPKQRFQRKASLKAAAAPTS